VVKHFLYFMSASYARQFLLIMAVCTVFAVIVFFATLYIL